MICCDCGNGRHESCPGGTWCNCQHRTDRRPAPAEPVEEDTPWTDAQEAEYRRLDSLSLECQQRVCSGCDGLKWGPGNTPCAHDCHNRESTR